MFHDNWHELAEKATNEQDPEKLMVLVDELNGVLSQREAAAQRHRNSKAVIATRGELNRAELH